MFVSEPLVDTMKLDLRWLKQLRGSAPTGDAVEHSGRARSLTRSTTSVK